MILSCKTAIAIKPTYYSVHEEEEESEIIM
jgi:hypothetical protein